MRQDHEEALKKLSAELLEENKEQATENAESNVVYRNFANNYGKDLRNFASNYSAYNADQTEEAPQELAKELLEEPKKERLWPYVMVDLLLLGGIFAVGAYWIFGLGMFG